MCWSPIWDPRFVKIGFSADVGSRMKALRANQMLVLDGGGGVETHLHAALRDRRVRHEHFEVGPETLWLLSLMRERQREAGLAAFASNYAGFFDRLGIDLRGQYPWQSSLWSLGEDARTDRPAVALRADIERILGPYVTTYL
ncbi:MAG TPA: GIY-YIG nuclease family protein [Gaiellaceae bacterium]|nr:GIY-YIG nuclease family protein [Gaiellaceae bacterium]